MKKILLVLASVLGLLVAGMAFVGLTPAYVMSAPGVATGIGAKLLCSSRFVSGFSAEQSFADLVQYSPILENLTIDYDEGARTVTTSLFGLSETTANFLPGIGCAIDYAGYDVRRAPPGGSVEQPAAPWPAGGQTLPGVLATDLQSQVDEIVARDNADGLNTRALLVAHQGRIVAERYAQDADRDTPLLGWSMAKSLTAIMLGNLELRGVLDLEAPTGFPEWQNDGRAEIRVSDLLHMTDGLDFSEEYNPGDDATAMLFTSPSTSDYVLAKPAIHAPGTWFNYSSGTANLASLVYFERTGASFEAAWDDYLEHIHRPMGFRNAIFEVDAAGVFIGSSYFYATARDWARMGQLMLNGGVINGERLVSEDWVTRATSPNQSNNETAYGYFWWLNSGSDPTERLRWPDLPADAYAAQGNRQQWVMIIPSAELVIVRLGWTAGGYPVNARFAAILNGP